MKQYYDEAVAFCSWAEQLTSISAENATAGFTGHDEKSHIVS